MIIESVHIRNFRCIFDETLSCENLTALVGANGSGKSAFLRGLELFYDPSPRIDVEDFHDRDTSTEIVIAVTFNALSAQAKNLFSSYLQGETLTVEKVISWDNGRITSQYHGATLQNPSFKAIRDALDVKDRGRTAKQEYEKIRATRNFDSLPQWSTIGAVQDNLKEWEAKHPEKCTRQRDDGQFFGFKEVAQGYLGRFTRLLFVPAVRDACDDCAEGRGSVLTELMDLVVRSALAANEQLKEFKQQTQQQYKQIIDPVSQGELSALADRMTETLAQFVPDSAAKVDLRWLPPSEINIPLPQADVKLTEDGYSSAVARTGHGLQRAFIMTILQHLAMARTTPSIAEKTEEPEQGPQLPDLVLAIEEPELYQHPNRQRHLAKIFLEIASGNIPGVAEKTQVIYATHSPLFVGIDRIDQIRLFRKTANGVDKPKVTRVISTTVDKMAEKIWEADGKPGQRYTRETLVPRLHTIMTPWMSEGFFSDVAVLVEGEDDRAAILGVAENMGHDLESSGFSVIPCGGKKNLSRPAVIFRELGIPVYVVWDSDKGTNSANHKDNHHLLRLMGQPVADWPSQVNDHFACFGKDLECTLHDEIGAAEFDQYLQECQGIFSIAKKKHAMKNPAVIAELLKKAEIQGRSRLTLKEIVSKIVALKK